MAGAARYGSANNVKHGEMEDAFMSFASATAAQDAYLTKITMTNGNRSTKLRHNEYHIQDLQAELCNLKLVGENRPTKVKGSNKAVQSYAHNKKQKPQWPTDLKKKNIITVVTVGHMYTAQESHTCQTHELGRMLET